MYGQNLTSSSLTLEGSLEKIWFKSVSLFTLNHVTERLTYARTEGRKDTRTDGQTTQKH